MSSCNDINVSVSSCDDVQNVCMIIVVIDVDVMHDNGLDA